MTSCVNKSQTCVHILNPNTQVIMRQNFTLASADVINNIRAELLADESLKQEFYDLLPNPESCASILWELLVKRISNLHGTECAKQMMDNLASMRRTSQSAAEGKNRQHVKYEQLRKAKRQKKIKRLVQDLTQDLETDTSVVQDLTQDLQTDTAVSKETAVMQNLQTDTTVTKETAVEPEFVLDYCVGDEVTVNEGLGSATKQWTGTVVEIDYTCQIYIICCEGVDSRPNGYNMAVPFQESGIRINQPIVGKRRKRKRKVYTDCI